MNYEIIGKSASILKTSSSKVTKKDNTRPILYCGGDGDDINKMRELAKFVYERHGLVGIVFDYTIDDMRNFITFTEPLEDLLSVMRLLRGAGIGDIYLFATSMGAYPAIQAIKNSYLRVEKLLLFDPADYYADIKLVKTRLQSWSGNDEFNPIGELVSDVLRNPDPKLTVDVVRFSVRNTYKDYYIEKDFSKRNKDNPTGYPRLNQQMIKSIYEKIHLQNRGHYIEINKVPHAFFRDGNTQQNFELIADLLNQLINNPLKVTK